MDDETQSLDERVEALCKLASVPGLTLLYQHGAKVGDPTSYARWVGFFHGSGLPNLTGDSPSDVLDKLEARSVKNRRDEAYNKALKPEGHPDRVKGDELLQQVATDAVAEALDA